MTSFPIGKKIFDNIVEYPLPKIQGVQDYIFYFVKVKNANGKIDPYGTNSRVFFDKYFKSHKKKDVNSLEDLIGFLFAEVKQGGVNQVREIIIVAHANAQQLLFALVNDTANFPKYRVLSPARMSAMQQDFFDDKFPDFNTKRKEVIKHLTADSWITLRACNFGQSKDGMYAVYSFFGGQANVYAPLVYQQFNWMGIGDGSRFETRLSAHEHLVKQRIIRRGHTPDRQTAVVNAIIDPAKYSLPVTLVTKKAADADSTGAQQYQAFKTDLDARKITDDLKTKLADAQMQLSPNASVGVLQKNSSWIIKDNIQLEQSSFDIEFDLSEQEDSGTLHEQAVSVVAEARLRVQLTKDNKKVPIGENFYFQLFINETENKAYKGLLFFLASYVEESERAAFDSITVLLNAAGPVPAAIADIFQQNTFDLSAGAVIEIREAGKTWLIHNTIPVLLRTQYAPSTDSKKVAHIIAVYVDEDDDSMFARQGALMATSTFGQSPNLPGTELLAYLDKFSLPELQDLIDHLRNPYRAENIIYLFHAINATGRRNQTDYAKWIESLTEINKELHDNPLARNPYTELSIAEHEDYLSDVYDFDVNNYWQQVKTLNPSTKVLLADLFSDEPLPAADSYSDLDDMDPDSPSSSEAVDVPGTKVYRQVEKFTVRQPEVPVIDCEAYGELLAKIKALNTTDPKKILEALGGEEVEGLKFRDYVMRGATVLNFTLELTEGFSAFAHSSVKIASLFGRLLETTFMEVLSFALPIVEALILTLEVFEAEAEGAEHFERFGKWVAVRQWLSDLEQKIVNKSIHFSGKIALDVHVLNEADPSLYWFYRYQQEEMSEFRLTGSPVNEFNIFGEDFKRGFDDGWEEIEKLGNEALDKVDEIFNEALKKSGLDDCKIGKLRDSGLIDMDNVSGVIMLKFVDMVRDKSPRHAQTAE